MNTTIGIATVYASNCHVTRRNLWNTLASLMDDDQPWCFIGDFNVILGCHEHKGGFLPAKGPMADFKCGPTQITYSIFLLLVPGTLGIMADK